MNKLELQSVSPALGPTAGMAPPGCCRGALGSWPQLLRAIDGVSGGAADDFQAGSPGSLLRALAEHPAALQGDQPPQDVYAHAVWFSTRLLTAAKTITATLGELPGLAESAATAQQAGTAVGELLAGPGGLKEIADAMAQRADDFVRRLGQSGARPGADAAAVLDTLEAVMRSWGDEWRAVSASLAQVASTSTPEQLGDGAYLQQALGLDRAVEQWGALAGAVQAYVQRLLVPTVTRRATVAAPG